MLYTKKGDDGKTKLFGCDQGRVSKSSAIVEALGAMDELNSYLGVCKSAGEKDGAHDALEDVQNDLFIIQAILAGSDKSFGEEKIKKLEVQINAIEKILPPITTFLIAGGAPRAAHLDFARTLARRAERRAVAVRESTKILSTNILPYLNRLSSFLYALARQDNKTLGIKEQSPRY